MGNLETRLAKLEAKDAQPYRWVWRNAGETDAEARARAGIAPDDNTIIIFWTDQDADL